MSYLARTPCVPLFCSLFKGMETELLLEPRIPAEGGHHAHRTVEPSPCHIRCQKISPYSGSSEKQQKLKQPKNFVVVHADTTQILLQRHPPNKNLHQICEMPICSVWLRKISPKRKFAAGRPCGHPAKKTRSGPPSPGKTSILARTCRADVHEKTSV